MTTENLEPGLFAVDRETRIVHGLLMPYGETSRPASAAGVKTKPVKFNRGDLRLPRDPSIVGLNRRHDRFDPFGRADELVDQDSGVVAAFRIADTEDGDAWLADHGDLVRLSPEVRNMVRRADGTATAELVGAALVPEGAFASAALFSIDPAAPDDEDDEPETTDPAPAEEETEPAAPADNEEEEPVADATVPNTLAGGTAAPEPKAMGKAGMFAALSAVANNRADRSTIERLESNWGGIGEAAMFALNDVDYDGVAGVGAKMTPPQWLGEVLDGTTYEPRFAPLFGHKDLTALAMSGWKWNVKPAGGAWTGNKDAIPSNAPSVTPVSENASRWAGGHDHAREHRDFGTPGYFEAYYAAMVESYLRWLDEDVVLTEALAAATQIEADNPAAFAEIGAAMSALIDGASAVVEAGLVPTFAIVTPAAWKEILKTPRSDILGYLNAAIGLEQGTLDNAGFVIRPSAELTNTLVGARTAADVYELPGSPIRAEALNIANGGIDTGLFGYGGLLVKNPAGIVEVTPYTP